MTHSNISHSIFSSTIKYPSNQRGKLQNLMSSVSSFHTHKQTYSYFKTKQNNKRSTMFQIPNSRPIITMFLFLIFIINIIIVTSSSSSDLRPGFYSKTCPKAETIVRDVMRKALIREPRSVASVMRFQFHDCFVNVCSLSTLSYHQNSIFFIEFFFKLKSFQLL